MMSLCVICGHVAPFTDGKCRECESHKIDVLLRQYEDAIARLEAHVEARTKIVSPNFRGLFPRNEQINADQKNGYREQRP